MGAIINNARIERTQLPSFKAMATKHPRSALPMNSWHLTPSKDKITEEIHAGREQYSAKFDYDLERIFADLKEREEHNPALRAGLQPVAPKL